MDKRSFKFSKSSTDFYFDSSFSLLKNLVDKKATILITDENVYEAHQNKFKNWDTIILKAGEEFKSQATVDSIIGQLIDFKADRQTTLVGVGGGVITDLTGFVASIYMRGIPFGFIPTTVLALVDASIGGKNGVDVGPYKNMVGVIRQPSFILHDLNLLKSLPVKEWSNGFAEIIKHACILDAGMFKLLENASLDLFQKKSATLADLIRQNALIKIRIVQHDEFEKNKRKLLNFGHTLGHALETQYELMHGEAISIGMVVACKISEQLKGFKESGRVTNVLSNYNLPVKVSFNGEKVFNVLSMDKKRVKQELHFVLLQKIGKAVIHPIPLTQVKKIIQKF
jgi:3-dehydroquinate synthase